MNQNLSLDLDDAERMLIVKGREYVTQWTFAKESPIATWVHHVKWLKSLMEGVINRQIVEENEFAQ